MAIKTTQEWKIDEKGALHLLPGIPDKTVDLILTDLPYASTHNKWDVIIDPDYLWTQYNRIIKDAGAVVLFGQGMFTAIMMLSNQKMWRYNLIWDKVLKSGHLNSERMPLRQHEDIMVFYDALPTYNPQKTRGKKNHSKKMKPFVNNNYGSFDVMDNSDKLGDMKFPGSIHTFEKTHPSITIHPTQKSLELIEYLIKTYSNEGDTVHDSCLGSGTTLEACVNLNRNCMGFEISDEWEWNYHKIMDKKKNMYQLSKIFKMKC